MAKLEHYDYRAVTAGLILSIIAIAMALGAPSTLFECHRGAGVCEVRSGGILGEKENHRFELAQIEQARKVCHRANASAACAYAVELRMKGRVETIVTNLSNEADATRFEAVIGSYLVNKGQEDMRVEKAAERGYPYGVLVFSLLIVALGVHKNMKDKGLA
jgi:hypothetical protein